MKSNKKQSLKEEKMRRFLKTQLFILEDWFNFRLLGKYKSGEDVLNDLKNYPELTKYYNTNK